MSTDYRKSQSYKEAYMLAARYCSGAERCFFDVKIKLRQWQVSTNYIDLICEDLTEEQFIDEQRYTNAFVNDKFKLNGWGKIKIQHHLKQKEIPNQCIQQSFAAVINDADYIACITKIIKKKAPTVKAKDAYSKKAKLIQFAQSRGFESYLTAKVVGQYLLDDAFD